MARGWRASTSAEWIFHAAATFRPRYGNEGGAGGDADPSKVSPPEPLQLGRVTVAAVRACLRRVDVQVLLLPLPFQVQPLLVGIPRGRLRLLLAGTERRADLARVVLLGLRQSALPAGAHRPAPCSQDFGIAALSRLPSTPNLPRLPAPLAASAFHLLAHRPSLVRPLWAVPVTEGHLCCR